MKYKIGDHLLHNRSKRIYRIVEIGDSGVVSVQAPRKTPMLINPALMPVLFSNLFVGGATW